MNINLKQLLTLAVFLGSVSCSSKTPREALIEKIEAKKNSIKEFQTNAACQDMIHALENPKCYLEALEKKVAIDHKCKDTNAHNFYRIDFDEPTFDADLAKLSEHCKTHDSLEGLESRIADAVQKSYDEKKKFLKAIVYSIPVISDYQSATDDFDKIIKSHIDKYIDDSLVYDGKRLTFSNLHKAVESIKNAHEVERKALDGVDAVLSFLRNDKLELSTMKSNDKFRIKKASVEPKKDSGSKGTDDKPKPMNIIEVAVKASDKSTSSPMLLAFFLFGSLVISSILLGFKAYTAEEVKDEEEEH